MVVQNEKEEGEVTDDEEEYLPVPQKRCADDIVTVTPNIEDLRLAVFRSVVQRKLSEKKVVTKTALSSFFAKTEHVKEFDKNDGSSSDMEVETWERDEEIPHQEDLMPVALKALNTTVCEAITASVSNTVNEQSANLDCGSSMIINERRNLFSVVFNFKADERLDSFGLGLKEQMRRKKAKSSAANGAVIENQRLAASFSFWSTDTPKAEITSVDRSADLRSMAPKDSMEISSLALLPIECVPSMGSASSAKSATIASMQPRAAVVRPNSKDSLALAEISSAAPLTAAQQRMKMVEDIARLKLEILMREKKNKAKDSGANNVEDLVKLSRARAQASRVTASQPAPALLQSSSDSIGSVAIYNTGAKMPIQTMTSNDLTLPQVATSANNAVASSQTQPAILPLAREGQTIPSVQGQGQGQSQTEEALRAAALGSRKKRRIEERSLSPTEKRAIEGNPSSLSVAAALSAPLPIPIPVPIPLHIPVQRVQHTLYPSSRTRLGFSLFGTEHLPLAAGLPSPPLPPSPHPPTKSQKSRKKLIASSISSSSTFGQNRRYRPTRTSSEEPPNASALFSTLMDIGVGLRAPGSSSSRSSSKRLSAEGDRKGREKSVKTKMSSKMKIADGLQNDRSVSSSPMEEEIYSHSAGIWTGSGASSSSSSRGLHISPPPGHVGYGSLTQASIGHGSGEVEAFDHSRTALYGTWDSSGLDYSYGQHDSLSQLLSPPEQRPDDWYAPPDPGLRTHQRRQEGITSRPRPPQVTLPPPPPPAHTHLSEDFIQRVRRLKQQKLKSSNTVASVSTDSELEFGEIFEADRSIDGNFVTPRDPPSCLVGSDTDMSVEEEIAADVEVDVEVEVETPDPADLDPAAQLGGCPVPEGHMPIFTGEATAALLCGPAGMVGIQRDSSCSSCDDIAVTVQSDSIVTSAGYVPIIVPDIISVSVGVGVSEIIPVSVNGTASLLVSNLHDIPVTRSTDSDVITAGVEVPLPIPMEITNSSSSSSTSASATEMRALKLREAELKTALEVKKIGRAIETQEKLYMYQVSKLTKARALTNRMREVEAESGAMVMKIREEQSQCLLRATKADLSRIELLTELSSARMQLSMMKDAESVLRSTARKPDRTAISAGTGSTTSSSASSSASASTSTSAGI